MTDITEHLSDEAVQYAEEHIGVDLNMGAIVAPPIPRDKVADYTNDDFNNRLRGHLYDLTDLALAINHSGDPVLDSSVEEDEEPYVVTDDTVSEVKVARGALISSYNRELAACAERLGLDPDDDDLVTAIRDELGYEVGHDVSVDEDEFKSVEEMEDLLDDDSE